jgi:glycosyltransferase involved in cell wall biosynthesis
MSSSGGARGLRVAHLIESDGPGGAERVLAHVATALQAGGAWNVAFLPAGGEGWLARQLERSGVTIEYYRLERPLSPAFARWLESALRRHRVMVAHSHEFTMAVYGAWASWRAGVGHVITMHGSSYYSRRLRRRLALRTAIALSGRTVAVSARLASRLSGDLRVRPSRITMIPNGVPRVASGQSTLRDELGLESDERLVVSVGNLYPVKGQQHLVDALALLADRHPTLHVAIAGRGDLEDALSARARDRGVAHRVHLLGLRSDIAEILGAADVFALPSLSEGLPLALLEAMFAGCPIVASDVGEVATALADGQAGVLVKAGDAAALAAALDGLLIDRDRARELGAHAARRAAAEYDIARMVGRYVDGYRAVMRTPRVRAVPPGALSIGPEARRAAGADGEA